MDKLAIHRASVKTFFIIVFVYNLIGRYPSFCNWILAVIAERAILTLGIKSSFGRFLVLEDCPHIITSTSASNKFSTSSRLGLFTLYLFWNASSVNKFLAAVP